MGCLKTDLKLDVELINKLILKNGLIKVSLYAKKRGLTRQGAYNQINNGTIQSVMIGGLKYIVYDNIPT